MGPLIPDGMSRGTRENKAVKLRESELREVLIIEPDIFSDRRGYFMETYHQEKYERSGIRTHFVQDNLSYSIRGTLRGLHYQYPHGQAKLLQAISGEIFDVVVDIRRGSPSFGKWICTALSEENKRLLYIPEGFAHGFCCVSDRALVHYKCSDFYAPDSEGGILWSDSDLSIDWPVKTPGISGKDSKLTFLRDIPVERLPVYEK
jgi:dTDP-4-dehydrorhamnose 3,5-epimerase